MRASRRLSLMAAACAAAAYAALAPAPARAGGKLAGVATVELTPGSFQTVLASYRDEAGAFREGTLFRLAPGNYSLTATPYADPRCGNCQDPATPVAATLGLRIAGRGIVLQAERPEETVIHTNAGYGLLFEDCADCVLRGVTVTAGVRDPDANATDAAIVARRSSLRVEDCIIADNLGDSTLIATNIVGIIGIAGRENARLTIRGNRIRRNSWDGVALYRDAEALIEDNLIDGVDKAGGRLRGGGRGVGIGLTWNATAEIRRNRVTRYWKGIGVFVDARAIVEENVVEELLTWGIALWDAGPGRPVAEIRRNVVYETGACGISLARRRGGEPAAGLCAENLVAKTGLDARYDDPAHYCAQCPIAADSLTADFALGDNWIWGSRRAVPAGLDADRAPADLDDAAFAVRAAPLLAALSRHPALVGARCLAELPKSAAP